MTRFLALVLSALLLAACEDTAAPKANGYVEGDFVFIGPESKGRIARLAVEEGAAVAAGKRLFKLDTRVEESALAGARLRAREAAARLADLERGARPQRIRALEAAVARAQAERELAEKRLTRRQTISKSPAISPEVLDEAESAFDAATAQVEQAKEELALARLPAREKEIEAARRARDAARAEAERLRREIARHTVAAPKPGYSQEILRREGEVAQPGQPVLSLLPEDGRRAVFFVRQAVAPRLDHGTQVDIQCDGCPEGLTAPITFVDSEVAFTPPVIFSPDQRERLMIRMEAKLPAGAAPALKPGQPITVRYPDSGPGESGQ